MTYKYFLAAGSAAVLGAGAGMATSVSAQAIGEPPTRPGDAAPVQVAPDKGKTAPPLATSAPSNFGRDRNTSVMQHPREGYEARGVRAGAFMVFPKVAVTAEYIDNIFATPTNSVGGVAPPKPTADVVWRVQPEVSASSDWVRHGLSAYARMAINRHQKQADEDTMDYTVGASGRLDVTRQAQVTGAVNFSRPTEPRTSPDSPTGATKPVRYNLVDLTVQANNEINRLRMSGGFNASNYGYSSPPSASGGVIDQSFRDRTLSSLNGRLDYAISPATAVFVAVTGNQHRYRRQPPAVSLARDSQGVEALVGANFEVGALARGEAAVGYIRQTFDDPNTKDLSGVGAKVLVEWFPSQLTTVTLTGSRTIQDSAVTGSAGYLSSSVAVHVDHELLRNVILSGQVGYGKDKYAGVEREDRRTSANLGATYLINHHLGLTVGYDYSRQETRKGLGSNFKANKVGVTLTVQY